MLAILLDLDGTIFDSLAAIMGATNAALAEVGQPPLRTEELRPLIGIPVDRQMEMLRGLQGPVVTAIADSYYRHFVRHVERGLPLYPGVPEVLDRLSDRKIGTMTTRRQQVARLMLRTAGLDRHFTAIVGGDEVERPKPEPDLPRFAAKSLGVPPAGCVVVGDAPVDILAGRAAGGWTVAATYGYGNLGELRQAQPHAEIASFSDLPKILAELDARADRGPTS